MCGPRSTGVHGPWGKGAALASADIPWAGFLPPEAGGSAPPETGVGMGVEMGHRPGSPRSRTLSGQSLRLHPPAVRVRDPPRPGKGHRGTQTLEEFGNFQWPEAGVLPPNPPGQRLALWTPPSRPPQPHRVPAPSWSQLLRCLLAPLEDLSCLPSLGPASPLQSPPCLTHTEPHALLISRWSQDGQGWCQGRLWALLRDLCGPWHILSHLFSCTRCLHGPSPLLSLGGWYFSGAPRTGRIKGGFVGGY